MSSYHHIEKELTSLLRQLDNQDPSVRIKAIRALAETGDEVCLSELRARMKSVHEEYLALIIAVGNLKKRLGVK